MSPALRHGEPGLFDQLELAAVASSKRLSVGVEHRSWEEALLDEDALFAEMEELGI